MRLLSLAVAALLAIHAGAADKLPTHKELPDPLVMLDGAKVKTADDWTK